MYVLHVTLASKNGGGVSGLQGDMRSSTHVSADRKLVLVHHPDKQKGSQKSADDTTFKLIQKGAHAKHALTWSFSRCECSTRHTEQPGKPSRV